MCQLHGFLGPFKDFRNRHVFIIVVILCIIWFYTNYTTLGPNVSFVPNLAVPKRNF